MRTRVFVSAVLLSLVSPSASLRWAVGRSVHPGGPVAEAESGVTEARLPGEQDEWPEVTDTRVIGGGAPTDGWQLLVESSKGQFSAGESIDFTLHLKNVSHEAREVGWWQAYPWYNNYITVTVTGSSGAAIARELDSNERRPGAVISHNGSVHAFKVAPDMEVRLALVDLRKFYRLASGDVYSITATWKTASSDGHGLVAVISNTVRVQLL
ncbi:MAG TPA: hypothetical protein VI756_16770 [Blastocatellia bacterium]